MESKLCGTHWTPLLSISLVTGGVVLPGNTYGEDSAEGKDVAIVIASLTHYPLEPSCLNTHTHPTIRVIKDFACSHCRQLSTVILNNRLEEIGWQAFTDACPL
jgi:hypothetical protein